MKIKKFLKNAVKALNIEFSSEEKSKIIALENLLIQLNNDKAKLQKRLKKKTLSAELREELKEELKIYTMHIKKGEELLEKKLEKTQEDN